MKSLALKTDRVLTGAMLLLITFGLVMIASAGIIYAQTRFGDQYYFFRHQLFFGIVPGLAVFYFLQRLDYHRWKRIATIIFLGSLVLLVLVFIPGIGIKTYGASRWIQLGSVSFQPSEAVKLALILYLSLWLESKGSRKIRDFFEGFLPFLVVMGILGFILIKQPDIGTLGVVICVAFAIYFASGAKMSHLATLVVGGIIGLGLLVKFEPYRLNRFATFLNPSVDPQGIGYHINQALIAIGSGGILGIGLGHSRQKFNYLPEPTGDSIFAIIGEELGLVGTVGIVLIFLSVAWRGLKVARQAPDDFGRLVAVGITAWIVAQAFINIASITGIIPLTGVPLPFISYGGTSVVFLMGAMGILVNISKQAKSS